MTRDDHGSRGGARAEPTGHALVVPVMPNRPLDSPDQEDAMGAIALRENASLGFVENAAFDGRLLDYDQGYQNSQAHSPRFQRHMAEVAAMLRERFPRGARVVEVGCGKGDFLQLLARDGHFEVSGFDAAYEGSSSNIESRFLTPGDRLEADLVVLRHTLEHIPRPHEFLQLMRTVFLRAAIYIEVPEFGWIRENETFFDITYEHVNYFTRQSLTALFAGPTDWGPLFDDQYQFAIGEVAELSRDFVAAYESGPWRDVTFESLFPRFMETLAGVEARLDGDRELYVWGAATKGCMFLVHGMKRGALSGRVAFAVDINPAKIGKYLPCCHVPIRSPEDLFAHARPGDLLIVSNPAYREEIASRIAASALRGMEIVTL